MFFGIILPLALFFLILAGLVYVLGEYLGWSFRKEMMVEEGFPGFFDYLERYFEKPILEPIERLIYRVTGIDPSITMNWKTYLLSALWLNLILFVFLYLIFLFQGGLPLNPAEIGNLDWDLAFHNAATFVSNTNQQHYAGETALSYFSQLGAVLLAMFASAATGIGLLLGFARGLTNEEDPRLGNFYVVFVKSLTRFLLPISFVLALFLISQGVPQTLAGPASVTTLEGATQTIARGPVATHEAIKMFGTNGGGFFAANAAHPFENPTPLSNVVLNLFLFLGTITNFYAFGIWVKKRRHGLVLVGAVSVLVLVFLAMAVGGELGGNPAFEGLGIDQSLGNMEGKEVRFGATLSALWGVSTTSTTNGGVNSMHDSFTAMGGLALFLGMSLNSLFAGVGTGVMNLLTYVFLAAFMGALMIGRAPVYLGKKLESDEIKFAAMIILLLPTLVLFPTGIAVVTNMGKEAITNPEFHGFSQVMYEFFSAGANNGSGLEGLMDDTVFYNIAGGMVILLARYIPLLLQMMIAGSLAKKNIRPETEGTLKVENVPFLVLLLVIMVIIGGLVFIPALSLGPIAELLSLW
ncbi:MAG: potassium-transporting ATPase subunit KdpA [Candidatus Bipolaricaulota bacterium]|nr:potassium-transporting ATPase subunit A [Candidatus Bipolaricaulota bacterium]